MSPTTSRLRPLRPNPALTGVWVGALKSCVETITANEPVFTAALTDRDTRREFRQLVQDLMVVVAVSLPPPVVETKYQVPAAVQR